MKQIIIFLSILICTSCSRIVSVDYPLLDEGTICQIENVANCSEVRVKILNRKDSAYHQWCKSSNWDDLWFGEGRDSLKVGDNVYVYNADGQTYISKISMAEVKNLNEGLSNHFMDLLGARFWWSLIGLWIVVVVVSVRFSKRTAVIVSIVAGMAIPLITPGSNQLSFCDEGKITWLNDNQIAINDSNIYLAKNSDIFDNHRLLRPEMYVYVYRYGYSYVYDSTYFVSCKKFSQKTLNTPQAYPERYLFVMAIWLGGLVLIGILGYAVSEVWDAVSDPDFGI